MGMYNLEPIQTFVKRLRFKCSMHACMQSGGRRLPIKPEDMLTQEDIKKLINGCNHPRDQALIVLLYESAARAEEIVKLKVDSIVFDEFGAKVTLEGNTGARIIRLVACMHVIDLAAQGELDRA